jgi:hypothetical protein
MDGAGPSIRPKHICTSLNIFSPEIPLDTLYNPIVI